MSRQALATAPARSVTPASAPLRPPLHDDVEALAEAYGTEPLEHDAAAARDPEVGSPTASSPDRMLRVAGDFAGLSGKSGEIHDHDLARLLVTRLLLQELAPALGLDVSHIEIRIDGPAESRVNAAGAIGLQDGATIHLHPGRFHPETERGRYLLAHEAVHAAQRGLTGSESKPAAEREAEELGLAFARQGTLHRPQRPLRAAVAAAVGAETPAPPPTVEESTKIVDKAVAVGRSREIAEIKQSLSGLWVSDGDVFDVMRILDSVSFVVANAIVRALDEPERYWLADNINPPHVYKHPRSVLLCYYQTLSDKRLQDAVDLKVFRALPVVGMSTDETEAAAYTLKHLRDDQRQELLGSENGPALTRIIQAPRPSAEELEHIRKNAADDAAKETALAGERQAILAHKDDPAAASLLEEVRFLLSPRAIDADGHQPNGASAVRALELLKAPEGDRRRQYVAEQMEQEGLIDLLLQVLPPDSYEDSVHLSTVLALVQSRLPYKNERLIEDLLSYGLFDWAIRDYEAVFAYKIVTALPLSDQYRFRLRDGGKWYLRLLENLPDYNKYPGLEVRIADGKQELEELRAKYKALEPSKPEGLAVQEVKADGETKLFYNASLLYEAKLDRDKGARKTLDDLIADFRDKRKDAATLYVELVTLGGSSLEPGKETPGDSILRESVIHELDRLGYIESLFGDLKDSFLFAEEHRISTVKIMLARDPTRAQAHARDLVSRHFTDWMVTDKEAYLAYLCVKALPADERADFVKNNDEAWSRIQGEMSESMRQSRDLNLYIGDKAGVDRASVLGQLAESATWADDNAALVGDLVRMAIAMTEHRFAFERSQEFKAIDQPKLAPIVETYRLWDPQKRPTYSPDLLKGTRWYEEGIFADIRSLWGGLVTLWNMDVLFVEDKIGVKVDLNDVQGFKSGDLMGAKLADPAKRGSADPDANKVTLLVGNETLLGKGTKSAELILPELLIESANVQLASTTLQSGAINLKGLHIHAAYDQDDLGQPTQAHVSLQSVEANDLLLAKSSSMLTVTRLVVRALRLAAGTIDTVTGGNKVRSGRSVPFPLLVVPLLAMFMLLALPIYLYKKIAGWVSEGLQDNTAEHFAADVATRTKAIDFTFDSLDVDSLTTSGGQHVGHVGVRDFAVRVGLNRATRMRAEKASIDQRLRALQGKPQAAEAIDRLNQRKTVLDGQQAQIEKDEQEYLQIQQQILKGDLSAERQSTLQRRLDQLSFEDKGGAFIDIGSVEASDLRGTVTSREPISIAGVHGEGGSAVLTQLVALPTATSAELSRRSAAGERPPASLSDGQQGKVSLDLGDVHTGEISFGGGLRSVGDIDHKIEELEPVKAKPEIAPLYESLQLLRRKAERYELMVRHGVSALTPPQLEEFRLLREQLRAQADLIIKSIDLTRAKVDVDVATGRVDVGAEAVRLAGVQLPGKGIDIDEVVARGLGVGALPAGGLLKWADWKKNLRDADGKVDELQVSGVRSKYHGLLFEKATLTGVYAKMKDRGDLLEVGLKRLNVEHVGIVPRIGLLNQRLAGLREKARLAPEKDKAKLDAEIAKLTTHINDLQALADARVAAYLQLEAAKTPKEIEAAKSAVGESDTAILLGLAQYGASAVELDDFGVRATGAGDVLTDVLGSGIDVDRILRRGVRVQGTGPDNRVLRRLKVTGANAKDDQADSSYVGKGDFELGETRLNLHAQRIGDSAFIDLDRFSVASFSLSEMLLTADEGGVGLQIGSSGMSTIEDVRLSGKVRLDKRPKTEGRFPQDFRFAHAEIADFRIGSVRANGLTYSSIPDKVEVTVKSGSIEGIWAKGVSIDIPEGGGNAAILGSAGIDTIRDVDVTAAMSDGLVRHASGRISGKGLQLAFLKEGEIEATIGDLNATAFSLRGPDGWARFSLSHLEGKVSYKNGALDIKELHLGSFDVPAIHWKVGAKGFVEADRPVSITDVRVAGRVETSQIPTNAKAGQATPDATKTRLDKLNITRLHVGSVEAQHLVYQDEDNRIELGPPEATLPKYMQGFAPLLLRNLDVWDLRWERGAGYSTGQAKLEKYEASGSYQDAKDLKSGLKVGIALTGGGMKAEVSGPGVFGVDIGRIEKLRGTYKDSKLDTKFSAGLVSGTVAFGPDFVEARNVSVGGVNLGKTSYKDPPRSLDLQLAFADKVKLGKVRQNYVQSTNPDKHGEKVPTTLEVENLEVFDVYVEKFGYDGSSTGKTPDGKETTSTQHIEGKSAKIEHLQIGNFIHNPARSEEILGLSVDSGGKNPAVWSPFRVRGLAATLTNKIGSDKPTITKLVTDVEGGPLTAEKITFATVKLGTVVGPDGKPEDVTRTSMVGGFSLTRLGFINPDLTMTGADGKITKISAYDYGSLEIKGIKADLMPNGTVRLPIDAVVAKNLQLQVGEGGRIKPGDLTVKIPLAEVKDIVLGLKGLGAPKGLEVLAAKVGSLSASQVQIDLTIDRSIDSSDAGYEKRLAAYNEAIHRPTHSLIAEPLSGLSGDAEAEPEHVKLKGPVNLPWDPNETFPIRSGKVNFDHVHPYAVNIQKGRLTIGNFGLEKGVLKLPTDLPGVHPEVGKHGMLDLRELVEGLYSAPPAEPKREDQAADLSALKDVNVGIPSLALGSGKFGVDLTDDKTLGPGDVYLDLERQTPSDNTLAIPWQHLGDRIELKAPHLHAKGAGIPTTEHLPGGTTKDVDVFNLYVRIEGLAEMSFKLHVWVDNATIKDIELGDLTLLNAANLAKLKAPDITEQKPVPVP